MRPSQATELPAPWPQILLHVKVVDVPRDALPSLGLDPTKPWNGAIEVRNLDEAFSVRLAAWQRENKVKVLTSPILATVMRRRAFRNSAGEFPIPVAAKDGSTAVEFQEFGTPVEFVPTRLNNGRIRLEILCRVRELDRSRTIPEIHAERDRQLAEARVRQQAARTSAASDA